MLYCTKSKTEATKGLDQRDKKWATKDCFLFGGWFFSKRSTKAVMGFGDDMIGMVKTNPEGFYMDTIKNIKSIFQEFLTFC